MDFVILVTLLAIVLGAVYFLYGEKKPAVNAFTEEELEKLDTKKGKKKAKKAVKSATKAAEPVVEAPKEEPEVEEEEAPAEKPKKKKKKSKKKEQKPVAKPEEEDKPKKSKKSKKSKEPQQATPEPTVQHESFEDDGEWSLVSTKEKRSTRQEQQREQDVAIESEEPVVVDQGTEMDLGNYKAAVIGKGGEVVRRLQAETGANFSIGKEDSMCIITGSPDAQAAGAAAVQAILDAEQAYRTLHSYEASIEVGNKVGAVVGKGGSTIKQIQAECGNVRLNIENDPETGLGTVLITGERTMVEKAKEMVAIIITGGLMPGEIVTEIDLGSLQAKLAFIGAGGSHIRSLQQQFGAKLDLPHGDGYLLSISGSEDKVMAASAAVRAFIDQNCHKHVMDITRHVGAIIGKRGSTIKRLQQEIGARMDVVEDDMGGQDLEIFGTPQQVKSAIDAVEQIKRDADDPRPKVGPGEILEEFEVPEKCIGNIIGRAGSTIKRLEEETGAKINIPRNTCTCYISGAPEKVQACKDQVDKILEEQETYEKRRIEREAKLAEEAAAAAAAAAAAEAEGLEEGEITED